MPYFDRSYIDRDLSELYMKLDDAQELEVWRCASEVRLCIEVHQKPGSTAYDPIQEFQLLEPRSGHCLAIRYTWRQLANLLERAKPVTLQRMRDNAKPCALHPTLAPAPTPVTPGDE